MRDIQQFLNRQQEPLNVIYVSSYVPRRCGIATYTKDLTNAINLINSRSLAEILVVTAEGNTIDYPWEAKYKISRNSEASYLMAAEYVNRSDADVVVLEHEFGLFGGEEGGYILSFIEALKKPLITTLHTVPDVCSSTAGKILQRIINESEVVTVMMDVVAQKLNHSYGIPLQKVVIIPHGVPDLPFTSTEQFKKKRSMSERLVLGNINLLSRDKGVEYVLEAVAEIAKRYPDVLYVCIGATHPQVFRHEGDSYRSFLMKKVRELDIKKNVRFVNAYVSLGELVSWLQTIDIYVTPYLKPDQVASGALSYAVGAGKACISTPYLYAKEVLAHRRGVLIPWRNSQALARAIVDIWEHPEERREMQKRAYQFGRLMTWPNVAQQHITLIRTILSKNITVSQKQSAGIRRGSLQPYGQR